MTNGSFPGRQMMKFGAQGEVMLRRGATPHSGFWARPGNCVRLVAAFGTAFSLSGCKDRDCGKGYVPMLGQLSPLWVHRGADLLFNLPFSAGPGTVTVGKATITFAIYKNAGDASCAADPIVKAIDTPLETMVNQDDNSAAYQQVDCSKVSYSTVITGLTAANSGYTETYYAFQTTQYTGGAAGTGVAIYFAAAGKNPAELMYEADH